MSESDSGPGRREVAYRMFAAEYDDADLEHSESDEERAPNYVVTPTGARVNRVFVVGVLTEVESVSEDVLRARVVDPTGAFVCYAGQYQPDERAFLERADAPTFVAMTGKARTFQPDDADVTYTSVRPEAINEVDAETRDRWTLQAAEQTVDRVRTTAGALALEQRGDHLRAVLESNDVDEGLASGIPLAFDHYGTTEGYLASVAEVALDAARMVAGDIDEVQARTLAPDGTADRQMPVAPREFEVPEGLRSDVVEETAAVEESAPTGEAAETDEEPSPDADGTGSASAASAEPATDPEPAGAEPDSSPEPAETEAPGAAAADDGEDAASESPVEAESDTVEEEPLEPAAEATNADEDPGDFEPGEFDLDEDEREEIESEYGTEFQSGTEVDEPGEADIETPDPDDVTDATTDAAGDAAATETAEAEARTESVVEDDPDQPAESDTESSEGSEAAAEPAEDADVAEATESGGVTVADEAGEPSDDDTDLGDADLEDVAVGMMEDLDDGSGADHDAVVEAVVDRTGADEAAVEDAIQAALMNGRCYEPDDDTLQAI